MRVKMSYLTTLLAGAAAAVAIAAAPTAAAAADPQTCAYTGGGFQDNQCQSPGNVQINDAPPAVSTSGMGAYGPFFTYDRGRR
jgi:hypothetical protein